MQRKCIVVLALLFSISIIGLSFLLIVTSAIPTTTSSQTSDELIEFRIVVYVLDLTENNRTGKVRVQLWFDDFPYDAIQVNAVVKGIGFTEATLQCSRQAASTYMAESEVTTWVMWGYGENYPFDSYEMRFELVKENLHFLQGNSTYRVHPNATFSLTHINAYVEGPKWMHLKNTWATTDVHFEVKPYSDTGFTMEIKRKWQTPFLQLVLPIIICFYLLGGTILIDRADLNSRLTASIALFVFVPGYLFTLQSFLPYRSTLSFPEFLLTSLLIGNAILAIFSMWPKDRLLIGKKPLETDNVAVSFAMISLLLVYTILLVFSEAYYGSVIVALLATISTLGYAFGYILKTRKTMYREDVIRGAGLGILIVGYGFSIWGLLGNAPAPFFVGVIFLVIGVCLLGLSRWLRTRRQKQSPFDPHETIGMDYYP